MGAVHTERHDTAEGPVLISIHYDESGFSPREYDNLTIIRGWHRRFDIGDGPRIDTEAYESFADMIQALQDEHGTLALIAPLFWYEHSGVTCRMGSPIILHQPQGTLAVDPSELARFRASVMDDAGWDSGVAGVVMVTRERIAELGAPEDTIEAQARAEVAEYADFLEGNVYGYTVSRVETCDKGHEHTEVIDSVWGFVGNYDAEDGCLAQARFSAGITEKESTPAS